MQQSTCRDQKETRKEQLQSKAVIIQSNIGAITITSMLIRFSEALIVVVVTACCIYVYNFSCF